MRKHKTMIITTLICLIPMIVAALVYDRLPEQMVTHWGNDGPNGYSPKMRKHKTMIITTLICLIPMIVAALVYDRLPEQMVTHWGNDGPNGYSPKAFACFGLPGIMVGLNLLVYFMMENDPKRKNYSHTLRKLIVYVIPVMTLVTSAVTIGTGLGVTFQVNLIMPVLVGIILIIHTLRKLIVYVIPVMTLVTSAVTIGTGLGVTFQVNLIMPVLVGIILIIIGNYLPKCKQNYTMGIKCPWTLNSEENLNKTHHLGGYLTIIAGILMMFGGLSDVTQVLAFVGIKCPWTLNSEENLNKTHHLGGYLTIIAGILMMFGGLSDVTQVLAFVGVIAAALIPFGYSFWLYKKGI